MVTVYHCPGNPSNTISSGDPKFYPGFQKVTSEHLEHCDLIYFKVVIGDHPTRLVKYYTILKSKLSNSNLEEKNVLWFQLYVVS